MLQQEHYQLVKGKSRMLQQFKNVLSIALSEPQLTKNSDCSNCQRLVDLIKEKLTNCSNKRKIQMLTLAPEDWTIQKTVEFFNVSEHAVTQAGKLKKEKGILATPFNCYREGLDKVTKKCVAEFYERNDMCPEIVCVQVKKIVLASETKTVQKRRFRRHFFWPIFLKYMPILRQNFQV